MSGFFAVSRKAFEEALPNLSNVGFKIMLDLLASAPHPLRTAEIPYTFRTLRAGESKLDAKVGQYFIILLLENMFVLFLPFLFLFFPSFFFIVFLFLFFFFFFSFFFFCSFFSFSH